MSVETRFRTQISDTAGDPLRSRNKERTVFLVEDDPLIAESLEDTLRDFGWSITHKATTVEEGLRIARQAMVDVTILDVNLCGEESYPVAVALNKRHIPIIVCTGCGWGLQDKFSKTIILEKPLSAERLRAALEQICARSV